MGFHAGLRYRGDNPELAVSGRFYCVFDHHPSVLTYRNGSINFLTPILTSGERAWVAAKSHDCDSFVVILRRANLHVLWADKQNRLLPESPAAEKILLRLVREGYARLCW